MGKDAIIITGANSGIGYECVNQFLKNDNIVVAISRNINNLERFENPNLKIFKCNVEDALGLNSIIKKISSEFSIMGLINNAGVAYYDNFENISNKDNDEMIKTNICGFTNMIETVLPIMQAQKKGTIINISSLADRYPRPNSAVYAATKSYVKSLSDSLRLANAKNNIRVCNISPSIINTPLLAKLKKNDNMIEVGEFVSLLKLIYNLPYHINIRDLVVAPTQYEG
ncbi:MAG: SDR family NAD(P)-dependent oxidoreductase [Burkholderiales bacterium]|nr:SDR family NAD(P)-dependent oxidoreductase [Burkholderiales bacterium]